MPVVLAVMLVVVFGASSPASAHGGYKGLLHLGHSRTATATTTLVGNIVDATKSALVVQNTGGGSALELQVNGGAAPLKANAEAGTATNLSADELDGKDSTQFANSTHTHSGSEITSGRVAEAYIDTTVTRDGEVMPIVKANDGPGTGVDADTLDGKDFSAFGAAEVINIHGPLALEGTYTSKGGTLIISASGSGYRTNSPGKMGMYIKVDGNLVFGSGMGVYTNETNNHKAFVGGQEVISGLPAGQHTIRLEANYDQAKCGTAEETTQTFCTVTNHEDRFRVSILEIPA